MESVSIVPASLAERIPLPDRGTDRRMLAKAREGFDRKIVVLDDDPTGVQTVHDLSVYTDWRCETLESRLAEEGTMFFVLTNSGASASRRRSAPTGRSRKICWRRRRRPACLFCW